MMEQMTPQKTIRTILPSVSQEQKQVSHKQVRVAAYCRVSTDSEEQEMSFNAQRSYYTEKIMRNPEWTLAGIFADEGISGTQANKRKEFMRMINLCRQGKIDMILTKSVSRFARNTVDCLNYVRELKALNIPIFFEKEGLNTMHMTSEIYIGMHGIFAQSESESLSGNVRIGKQIAAKKGNVTMCYKSFLGYKKGTNGQPEIVPEQAEIVRLIFQSYLAGYSQSGIKHLLEGRGIPTPMGKSTWTVTTIRSILTNEKYKGDALLQKTYVVDCISHRKKKNDDRPQYYVENNHPPIISREMYDRVQEEIARRNNKRKVKQVGTTTDFGKYSSKFALTELLVCGRCGTPYRRCTWTSHGRKRIVWRCISRLDYGKKYCQDSPTIYETDLHRIIAKAITELAEDGNMGSAAEALKLHAAIYYGGENSVSKDKLRAKELVAQIANAAKDGSYTDEMSAMIKELNAVKQQIAEKERAAESSAAAAQRLAEVTDAIDHLQEAKIQYDDILVRKLIDCIRVMPEGELEITFKGCPPRWYPLK